MRRSKHRVKALALISSGLDSLLAAKIIKDLGVKVQGIHFFLGFDFLKKEDRQREVKKLVRPLRIPIAVLDVSEGFLDIFLHPEHGYGSGVNPCIDCRLYSLRRAKEVMERLDAQFLITGEVVGQRPMTQNKPTLFHIDKVSGLKGLILRPLSAKLLPPTRAEEENWIDREKLYKISGRSRKDQIALAHQFGITRYNQPAGGCLLTDLNFAKRAKTLFLHKEKKEITFDLLKLLRLGRHFWPDNNLWVIVGRNKEDNSALERFREKRWVFQALNYKGPLVLAEGVRDERDRGVVAAITARYCSKGKGSPIRIRYERGNEEGIISCSPISDSLLDKWRV